MATSSTRPGSSEAGLRGWLANVLEFVEVRFELFTVEARMELQRLILLGVYGIVGALLLAFGVVFLALFITVALWESHALLALAVITVGFLGGGATLVLLARGKLRELLRMFSGTRDELRRDQLRLRGEEAPPPARARHGEGP